MAGDESWRTEEIEDLLAAILRLESPDEASRFFRDLCTLGELRDMAQRWAVVRMLHRGLHYAEISQATGASTATITRIASWLNHGEGGYRLMLDRLDADATGSRGRGSGRTPAPRTKPAPASPPEPGPRPSKRAQAASGSRQAGRQEASR